MPDHTAVKRLAQSAGMQLIRGEETRRWHLLRGQKVMHRAYTLEDVHGWLSAWLQHVR